MTKPQGTSDAAYIKRFSRLEYCTGVMAAETLPALLREAQSIWEYEPKSKEREELYSAYSFKLNLLFRYSDTRESFNNQRSWIRTRETFDL